MKYSYGQYALQEAELLRLGNKYGKPVKNTGIPGNNFITPEIIFKGKIKGGTDIFELSRSSQSPLSDFLLMGITVKGRDDKSLGTYDTEDIEKILKELAGEEL